MVSWWLVVVAVAVIAFLSNRPKKQKDVKGQVILITGGASGLGLGMAEKFIALGARVVIWDIHEGNLKNAKQQLEKAKQKGGQVYSYICDVSDRATIYRVAEQVKKEVGKVDILVNNAGIVVGKTFLATTDEQSEKVIKVNALAIMWAVKAFLPDMIKSKGHLVTIASAAGHTGAPLLVDYCTSKYAACGFMDSLRQELIHTKVNNVKCTTVMPFYINTGMFEGVKSKFPFPILTQEYVVNAIVASILQEEVEVFLPWLSKSRFLARMFPTWVGDWIEVTLGISSSMDEFKGRA